MGVSPPENAAIAGPLKARLHGNIEGTAKGLTAEALARETARRTDRQGYGCVACLFRR